MTEADKKVLLELTPEEQKAIDQEISILGIAKKRRLVRQMCGVIAINDLEVGAASGKMHLVKFALRNGLDVNSRCVVFGSALHAAAAGGHLDIVKLLVAVGGDIHARDKQNKLPAELATDARIVEFLRSLTIQNPPRTEL